LHRAFGIRLPAWETSLARCMADRTAYGST
jgi:hypothetical protein